MSTPAPKCPHCHDTGSTEKSWDGLSLDCGRCDVAVQRAKFDAWALVNLPADRDAALWLAYQRGLAEGSDGRPA
jgi:hypothetical protein